MNAADFVSRLGAKAKPKPSRDGWQVCCPAHKDKTPSLNVTDASDRVLIHCQAGCTPEAVCAAAGLKLADLFFEKPERNGHANKIVAAHDYRDETGKLLFQVCRFEPKDFRQRKPDATALDGWTWKTSGVRRVLYRLPEILRDVKRGLPVVICEGEKDCDALAALGFSATCNAGGAGKWRAEYSEALRGARVYVIADKDQPGREHAQAVAASLQGVASFVAVLELPDVNGNSVKDAADFIAAGGTAAELQTLFDAAPEWTPAAAVRSEKVLESSEPDTADAEFHRKLTKILLNANLQVQERKKLISDLALNCLLDQGQLYYHIERRDFDSAMFFNSRLHRLERLRSDSFAAWLAHWIGIGRTDTFFKMVAAHIETCALLDEHSLGVVPETFWTRREDRIYISNGDAALCRISPRQVKMLANGTDGVLFSAGRTLQPWQLTEPRDFFDSCRMFSDIQNAAPNARELVRLWFIGLPTDPRSKPPLVAHGEVGSGKTALMRGIGEAYGLPPNIAKVEEKLEADFWPTVDAGGLLVLDNADSKTKWLADAVAAAATGGCVSRRRLYTDSDIVPLRARAWLAITTSNPTFANDSGLADRLLVVRLKRREGTTSDAALTSEILANRDAGLSFVAHTLAAALADTAPTPDNLNARHPDFASFAVRIGRALGRESQAVAALQSAEADKSLFCLQNDTLGAALLAHVTDETTLGGDAAELRTALAASDSSLAEWSNKSFGRKLSALWPHVTATFDATRTDTRCGWKFRIGKRPSAPLRL